jgi:hypothetical protein
MKIKDVRIETNIKRKFYNQTAIGSCIELQYLYVVL